ncbi:MAG: phosphomannomutase/phosphoglucomutase [Bacteriovoracia bacterium]
MFNPHIFREYDIRGKVFEDFDLNFVKDFGFAFGQYLLEKINKKKAVVAVGRDCRLSSPKLYAALSKGILEAGVDIIYLGVVPTPVTYFSGYHLKVDATVSITGSHNPAAYNGFKITIKNKSVYGEEIKVLKTRIESLRKKEKRKKGIVRKKDLGHVYIKSLLSKIRKNKKKKVLKIVIDSGNATGSKIAPILLKKMGFKVIPLFCKMDGRFPNHHPDPGDEKNLRSLISEVKSKKADLGLAFDGDCDRIGVIDSKGRILSADDLLILYAREILKRKPRATIIGEVKCSNRFFEDVRSLGGNAVMWKAGHSLIKAKMREISAELAGEVSGHIFFKDRYYGFDDALYAAVRLLEILVESSSSLAEIFDALPKSIITPEIRVETREEIKFKVVEKVRQNLSKKYKIIEIDGVRVETTEGWGLLRASNTQPVLNMRFEGKSQAVIDSLRTEFESEIKKALNEV